MTMLTKSFCWSGTMIRREPLTSLSLSSSASPLTLFCAVIPGLAHPVGDWNQTCLCAEQRLQAVLSIFGKLVVGPVDFYQCTCLHECYH